MRDKIFSLFSRNSQFTKKEQGTPFGNFSSLYYEETCNSQKKNFWKFWLSLFSKNSQFTKKEQGTPFENFGSLYSQEIRNSQKKQQGTTAFGNFGSL